MFLNVSLSIRVRYRLRNQPSSEDRDLKVPQIFCTALPGVINVSSTDNYSWCLIRVHTRLNMATVFPWIANSKLILLLIHTFRKMFVLHHEPTEFGNSHHEWILVYNIDYYRSRLLSTAKMEYIRPITIWYTMRAQKECPRLLTHYDLVTPYGDIDLGQHCLRWWLVFWWHQAITWTKCWFIISGFLLHLKPISREMLKIWIREMCLKNTHVNLLPRLSGVNLLCFYIKRLYPYPPCLLQLCQMPSPGDATLKNMGKFITWSKWKLLVHKCAYFVGYTVYQTWS